MTKFNNIIIKAKRRMAAARVVYVTGRALVITIVIAIAVLTLDRLMSLDLPTVAYITIVAAGVVIGVITALLRRVDTLSVAVRLDRRLDLRDRLGTAEAIRNGDIKNDEFGQLITRDAERVAQKLDIKAATPIKFNNDWSLASLLIIVLGAAIAFVPSLDRSSKGQTLQEIVDQKEQLQQQQQKITGTIENALADIDDESLDDDLREDLDALRKLAQQLSDNASSADDLADARNRSAAELDSIASRLEEQSQRNSQTIDSIAERFAGMQHPESPGKSEQFDEALRNGDFDKAAEELDELTEDSQQMSQSQRDEVADHFRNMSEQLSQQDELTSDDEKLDPLRGAMHDLGMDDKVVDDLLDDEKSEDELASALEEKGVDEDVARELAEDANKAQQQKEIDKQVDEQTRQLADALNDAADDIKREESPQDKSQDNNSDNGEDNDDSPNDQQDSAETNNDSLSDDSTANDSQDQQDDQVQEESENRAVDNDEVSQETDANNSDNTQQTESGQRRQVTPEQEQQEGQGNKEQVAEQGRQQGKKHSPGQKIIDPSDPNTTTWEEISQKKPSKKEDNQSPDEESKFPYPPDTPNPNNQQLNNDQSSKKQGNSKEDKSAKKNLPKNLGKALRELARKQRDAEKGIKDSKRLREAARRIADSLSEEEKRELVKRWMGEFDKPADTDPHPNAGKDPLNTIGSAADRIAQNAREKLQPDIEDVDVTGDKPATKSIFEWLSDQPITGDPQRTAQSKQVVRQARSAAEHAVGESTVPKRYHDLIQRYFGKLNDTIEKAAKQTSKTETTTKEVPVETTTEDDS